MDIIDNYETITYYPGDIIKYDTVVDYNYHSSKDFEFYRKGDTFEGYGYMIAHYKNGICHRDKDKPAVRYIGQDYAQIDFYVKEGVITRDNNLPAYILTEQKKLFNNLTPQQARQLISSNNDYTAYIYYFSNGKFIDRVSSTN